MSYFWNGYILRDFIFHNFNTSTIPGFIGVFVALLSIGILYEGLFFLKKSLLQKFFLLAKSNRAQTSRRGFPTFPSFRPSESDDVIPNGGGGDSVENGVARGDTNNPRNSLLAGEEVPGVGDVASSSSREGGGQSAGISRNRPASRISFPIELGLPTPESSYLLLSSILHGCYAFIGYTLMNAVMTFNIWVLVAICTGIGMGYFFFRSESSSRRPRKSSSTQPFRNAIETDDDDDPRDYHSPELHHHQQRSPRSPSSASSGRNKTENGTPSKSPAGSSGGLSRGSSGRRNRIPNEETPQKSSNDKNTSLPDDDGDNSTVVGQVIVVGAQVHNNYQQSV